jgi:hypothetical protein
MVGEGEMTNQEILLDQLSPPVDSWREGVAHIIHTLQFKRIAEIGVCEGELSRLIWKQPQIYSYYLVDPLDWEHVKDIPKEPVRAPQQVLNTRYSAIVEAMPPHTKFLRMTSLDAAKLVPDKSLDFVFIDALHDYDSVKADIKAWLPKVRDGGILAGDDYANKKFGVTKAVDEVFGSDMYRPLVPWLPTGRNRGKVWCVDL